MIKDSDIDFLKKQKFFEKFSDVEISFLKEKAEELSLAPKQYVIHEGETSRDVYFIAAGESEVTKKRGDTELVIGHLSQGSLFGEIAFIDSGPRSTSIRATSPSIFYKFPVEKFDTTTPIGSSVYNKFFEISIQQGFDRIRSSNSSYVSNLREQIKQITLQNNFGAFFIYAITFFSLYEIITSFWPVVGVYKNYMGILGVVLSFLIPSFIFVKWMHYPLDMFGIRINNLIPSLRNTAAWIMGSIFCIGSFYLWFNDTTSPYFAYLSTYLESLLSPTSLLIFLYIATIEFVQRGIIQTSLQKFLNDRRGYKTVFLIAAFLFSPSLYLGLNVALIKFYIDIACGTLYLKQQNLIGPILLHFFVVTFGKFYY